MINTRKIFWLLAVISLAFIILEIGTTESKSINQESTRIGESSGTNRIPDYLKDDDDFNGESENGSGEVSVKEKPKTNANTQASVFEDKQADKLVQAQNLGTGETEGSAPNAIPEFKEANDGSGEIIQIESTKDKESQDNSLENLDKTPSTIQASAPSQEGQPIIITGGQATAPQTPEAAVQPAAQVFNDAAAPTNTATQTQSYNYATAPAADQTQAAQPAQQAYAPQTSTEAQPETQYYNDASAQATQAAQPAGQTYSDASQQTASAAAQYYNDSPSQTDSAAQPGVQAYSSESTPQQSYNEAEKVPQPVDVAMEASHTGNEANQYTSNPVAKPSQVFNDANGLPQSVDAAAISAPQQTQYYTSPAQQTTPEQTQSYTSPSQQTVPQQTASNDLTSSFMASSNQPQMDYNTAAAQQQQQQPMQYTSQPSQDTQNTQAYQGQPTSVEQMRKLDISDENKFRTVVCQNNQDMITCPQGKKININDAHYGSMGMSSCQGPQTNFLPIQPCETPGALNVVKTSCDDMENCMLSANDDLFGNQCQSDKKYLDVTYSCDDNKESQQYMYPGAQQAPSPYYQASPYGNQQQQQQPLNDEPKIAPPPPPKIPELMSTLVQLSKNHQKYGSLNDQPTCSSCNKCSQCYKSALCSQCGFCQNKLCDMAAASLPVIPENLRPLWEQWNERTADMNSMEMSGLILAPPKTWAKKLSKKTEVTSKRSHIKHAHKKADKKTHKNNTKKHS